MVSLYMGNEINNIKQILQFLLLFIAFFVGYSLCRLRPSNLELVLETLLLGFLLNAAVGLFQSISWIVEHGFVLFSGSEWFRVKGINMSPADYVSHLLMGFFLLMALPKIKYRKYYILVLLILLVISMSRSAIIILFFISALFFWRLRFAKKIAALSAVSIFGTSLLALNVENFLLVERVADITNYDFNVKRILVYQDVLENTFGSLASTFFGSGYGSYVFFHPLDGELYNNTHNIYFNYLYGGGLLGLFFFLILIISAFLIFPSINHKTAIQYSKKKYIQPIWLKYMLISILIIGLVETNLLGVGTGWLVAYLLGIAYFIKTNKMSY
ncbi:hypothetical protein OAN74_01085 [Gammaproteobacteria bacterium]|nr:hypothetical protein [Gammaproteobacteria bacterium]